AESLRHNVGLHVTVVVLAGPDDATVALDDLGHHVIDEPVLIGEASGIEIGLELRLEYFSEDVLEPAIVGLEDGVFGRQVQREATVKRVRDRGPRVVPDRVVKVVHAHRDPAAGELGDIHRDRPPDGLVGGLVGNRHRARAGDNEVAGPVLVAVRMAADDNRLGPAGHEPRDALDHYGLTEDDAAEDVTDRAVGGTPHLLQAELGDPGFVRRNGRALDPDAELLDRVCGIDRYLVVGGISVLDRQVVVTQVDVQVGQDQLILDELPDNTRHLIAVEFYDGIGHLDLGHAN